MYYYAKELAIKNIVFNKILFAEDYELTGKKRFFYSEYDVIYNLSKNNIKNIYETIENKNNVKLFFDLDFKNISKDEYEHNIKEVINRCTNILEKYKIIPKIIILDASTSEKFSSHIIFSNIIFSSILHLKVFIEEELKIIHKYIDRTVYRVGLFRLYLNSKKNKNNQLKLKETINYCIKDDYNLFLDTLVTNCSVPNIDILIPNNIKKNILNKGISNIEKNNIPFKNYEINENIIIKIREAINKLDQSYLDDYIKWCCITYCIKDYYINLKESNEEILNIWKEWNMKNEKYDCNINNKIFNNIKLDYIDINNLFIYADIDYKIEYSVDIFKIILDESKYKIDFVNESKISNKIINNIINNKIVFIKSGMGTGKTTILNEYLKDTTKNIISVITRVSLITEHKKIKASMESYKDNLEANDLICQLDSLIKVNIDHFNNGILILDEVSSLFNYLSSTTLNGKRLDVFNKLFELIKNVDQVICLDADLNEISIKIILDIRKSNDYYFYNNNFKTKENINCFLHNDEEIIIKCMLNDLNKNIKFIACFDSLSNMHKILDICDTYLKENKLIRNIKSYSSQEGEELVDTSTWIDCFVFYSPKIIYGIDYSNYNEATKIYSIITKKVLNPLKLKQQIGRCRNQKELHLYIKENNYIIKYYSNNQYVDAINDKIRLAESLFYELKDICGIRYHNGLFKLDIDNLYIQIYIYNEFIDHILNSNIKKKLLILLKDDGYNIIKYNNIKENNEFFIKMIPEKRIVNKQINTDIIQLLCLDMKKLSKLEIEIVSHNKKFNEHINLCKFFYTDDEFKKLGIKNINSDMKIDFINSDFIKISMLRKINEILNIKNRFFYDHTIDELKFKNIINDKWILENINVIKNIFRLSSQYYNNFNLEYGYKKLYHMSIVIFKQLCGNKNIITKKIQKYIDGNKLYYYEYTINYDIIKNHIYTLLKRKRIGINLYFINFFKLDKNDFFIDDK